MRTLTGDLAMWGAQAGEEAARLRGIEGIDDNAELRGQALDSLDELGAEYIGTLTVVMAGPEIVALDKDASVVYAGAMLVRGKFCGGAYCDEPGGALGIGYYLRSSEVTATEDLVGIDLKQADRAVGLVTSTKIWAPDDIFVGGSEINPNEGFRHQGVAAGQKRLEKLEAKIDFAATQWPLPTRYLTKAFQDKWKIRDGLELTYFLRRLNVRLLIADLQFEITASQIHTRDLGDDDFTPSLDPGTQETLALPLGAQFGAKDDDNGNRKLCLISRTADENGAPIGLTVINLDDIIDMEAIRVRP